jgi:hypothetical protein
MTIIGGLPSWSAGMGQEAIIQYNFTPSNNPVDSNSRSILLNPGWISGPNADSGPSFNITQNGFYMWNVNSRAPGSFTSYFQGMNWGGSIQEQFRPPMQWYCMSQNGALPGDGTMFGTTIVAPGVTEPIGGRAFTSTPAPGANTIITIRIFKVF